MRAGAQNDSGPVFASVPVVVGSVVEVLEVLPEVKELLLVFEVADSEVSD